MTRPPVLSTRDLEILSGIGESGFMTAGQVERHWFAGPSATPVGARRRCQRVLRRLTDERLLHRLERRQGGSGGGSEAAVYRLAPAGRRVVGLAGRGTHREPSERLLAHSLATAEVVTGLAEAERSGLVRESNVVYEPQTWRRFSAASGVLTLKPDLLVEVTSLDRWELRWWVEVDRATEHLPTVLAKAQLYERYWRSGLEAQHHEVFPRVLWSVPHRRRAEQIQTAIGRQRSLTADLFRVATSEQTVPLLINQPTNETSRGGQS